MGKFNHSDSHRAKKEKSDRQIAINDRVSFIILFILLVVLCGTGWLIFNFVTECLIKK